jgi:hypothetical protein
MTWFTLAKNWLKDNRRIAILSILAVLFFFIYSFLILSAPLKFNSPDENANYFFIKLFAERGELKYYEPLNLIAQNIIHPRSINVSNGYLVPGSFLGLILIYGSIAKVFSIGVVPFLTPLISVVTVFFFYGLVKKIFDDKIAFVSSILLLFLPAFWYYAARGLFLNVLFVDLLVVGFYWLTHTNKARIEHELNTNVRNSFSWKEVCCYFLAGLFIGLALAVRTSEIIWVGTVLLALLIIYHRRIKWQEAAVFIAGIILVFSPIFYYNYNLYGGLFHTGYEQLDSQASNSQGANILAKIFLPFGFHPRSAWRNFSQYFLQLFWYLVIPLIVGLVLWFQINYKRIKSKTDIGANKQFIYLLFYLFIILFLIVYYGSWDFSDNIIPGQITIGNSHVRYWLPIFVLSLPFVGLFLIKIFDYFKQKWLGYSLSLAAGVLIIILSSYAVLAQSEESLLAVRENLIDYQNKAEKVLALTELDSIIITERSDKIFFPERRIIVNLDNSMVLTNLPALLEKAPVYYYTYRTTADVEELNEKVLKNYNLKLTNEVQIEGKEKLLKVERL